MTMHNRDTLGRLVRVAWIQWARTQPDPKPSWLVPYDRLSEPDQEADRQIGEAVAAYCDQIANRYRAAIAFRLKQHRENLEMWENGFLAPTEPDPDERAAVKERLRVAIHELEEIEKEAG